MNKIKGIIDGILYYLIIFLSQKIAYFFYCLIIFKINNIEEEAFEIIKEYQNIYILAGWIIGLTIILFVFKALKKKPLENLKEKPGFGNVLHCIIIGFGTVLLINGGFYVISKFIFLTSCNNGNQLLYEGNFIVTLIIVGFVTVIFEEVLFRGFIMERLTEVGSNTFAIIVQGIIFSISHFDFIQGISIFLLGIIAGYTVMKTKSITSGIIIHCVFNISNLYLYKTENLFYDAGQLMIFIVLGLLLIYFGMERLRKNKINLF